MHVCVCVSVCIKNKERIISRKIVFSGKIVVKRD